MAGDVHVQELSAVMGDEEEHIQGAKEQRVDGEQVGCPNAGPVIVEEGQPRLARSSRRTTPSIATNGPGADGNAELEQLTAYALGAPQTVLVGDGSYELPHFEAEPRTATNRAGLPAPEQSPQLAVPADDGVGSDDDEVAAPLAREAPCENPQESIGAIQSRSRLGARKHSELMAKE